MKRQLTISFLSLLFLFDISFGQTIPKDSITLATKKLLTQPFDLHLFKNKKGQSNSGGPGETKFFFKPGNGVYWGFFLFRPMVGYYGNDTSTKIHTETGLHIITFQPADKYQNKYLNPNETLIQVTARYNEFDLPELAFVGHNTKAIRKKLGPCSLQKKDCLIYFYGNNILTLHTTKGAVDWLKYTRLKFAVTIDNIPNELLTDY